MHALVTEIFRAVYNHGKDVLVTNATGRVESEIFARLTAQSASAVVVVLTPLASLARKSEFPIAVSPERLGETLRRLGRVDALLVEHGDCVLECWGARVKEELHAIGNLRNFPIIAFCGGLRDVRGALAALALRNASVFGFPIDRKHVKYVVVAKRGLRGLAEEISDLAGSGVVYCATKKEVEQTRLQLASAGESVTSYHGDLAYEEREQRLESWTSGAVRLLVTTNCTTWLHGCRTDVRFVIHATMARSLENFLKISSVAGLDGQSCVCLLFFEFSDKSLYAMHQPGQEASEELLAMTAFGEFAHLCKRKQLHEYFSGASTVQAVWDRECCRADEEQCSACESRKFRVCTEISRTSEVLAVRRLCEVASRVLPRPLTLLGLRDAALGTRKSACTEISDYGCLRGKFATAAETLGFLRFLVIGNFLNERVVALGGVHGGHATYVEPGRRSVGPESEILWSEISKKRRRQTEKLEIFLSAAEAERAEQLQPASQWELEQVGIFSEFFGEILSALGELRQNSSRHAKALETLFCFCCVDDRK